MKCMIIDDEPLAQNVLKKYISDHPDLELLGTYTDAFRAADELKNTCLDLIFLDIEMPGLSGIAFIKSLVNPPIVIFTTAYPRYAVEGFNLDAADYLLKPFSFDRFLKAVNKASIRHKAGENFRIKNIPEKDSSFLLIKANKKLHRIDFDDIIFIESTGDYIRIHTENTCLTTHETMKNIVSNLPTDSFIRIHKSYIIAIRKIDYIEGNQISIRKNMLPIGASYRNTFLDLLKQK